MSKTLFVRGIRSSTHKKINDEANKKGITAASILEDAFEKWFKDQKDLPKKHFAVLYSDEQSLLNFMLKVKEALGDEWLHVCFGPSSHFAIKFLEKHGWNNVTIQPFSQVQKKTSSYIKRIFNLRSKAAKKKPVASMGFITEHLAHTNSFKKANWVEGSYNNCRSAGIAFCPYDTKYMKEATLNDKMEMFGLHDKVLIVKKDDVFELDVRKTNLLNSLL